MIRDLLEVSASLYVDKSTGALYFKASLTEEEEKYLRKVVFTRANKQNNVHSPYYEASIESNPKYDR